MRSHSAAISRSISASGSSVQQLVELARTLHARDQRLEGVDPVLQRLDLLHDLLRGLLVRPEVRAAHALLERGQLLPLVIEVKDTSSARRADRRTRTAGERARSPPFRLPGMTRAVRREGRTARAVSISTPRKIVAPRARLEELLPSGEDVVQRLLEVRRRLGELPPICSTYSS